MATVFLIVPTLKKQALEEVKKNSIQILDSVSSVVEHHYSQLKINQDYILSQKKQELKDITILGESILKYYHTRATDGKITFEQGRKRALKELSEIRYGNNNYLYSTNEELVLTSHGMKKFIGLDFNHIKGAKGKYFAVEMAKKADEYGDGFTRYWWKKIGKKGVFEKIGYIKKTPYFNLYIGTGIYIDELQKLKKDLNKKLTQQLELFLKGTTFKKSGYFYIASGDGVMINHPDYSLVGNQLKSLKVPNTEKYFFNELKKSKSKKYVEMDYVWNKPEDLNSFIYKKRSWIKYIPENDLFVVATVYLDDLEESASNVGNSILVVVSILFLIALMIIYFYFKKITMPINQLSQMALAVRRGDLQVRSDIKRDDEIGILSDEFNRMLVILQEQFDNLELKVQERTKELDELNENLQEEVKKAVLDLREKDKIILEKSKMETMGQMVGIIAHQLKQPLSGIHIMIDSMAEIENLSDELQDVQKMVMNRVRFLSSTVDTFRNYFNPNKMKRDFSVRKSIQIITEIISSNLKNSDVTLDIAGDDFYIYGIDTELQQVIMNLVINSKDALVENRDKDRKISIEISSENREIKISDNGGGIPDEVIYNIFKYNFTTKGEKGTGIGLYMVDMIIKDMKGDVTVHNSDEGAVFIIRF
ncbi:MAG: cache domain-containing protein [Campylobacterales bacterium]|nr:cache domain-containing protein [Campylobacterales bacterium]